MKDDLVARFSELQDAVGGCTDGYCVIHRNRGQHTNGGCRCLDHMDHLGRQRVGHMLRVAQDMAAEITRLREQLAILEAALDAADKDAGLSDNGSMWRFWSFQAQTLADANKTLREQLAEAQPKPFVSTPGTFDIAELSDAVEIGGKAYVTYDSLMEIIARHAKTAQALSEARASAEAAWEQWNELQDLLGASKEVDFAFDGMVELRKQLAEAERQRDAARAEALEEAAQRCDVEADSCDEAVKWGGSKKYIADCKAASYAMRDRAAAIRALIKEGRT